MTKKLEIAYPIHIMGKHTPKFNVYNVAGDTTIHWPVGSIEEVRQHVRHAVKNKPTLTSLYRVFQVTADGQERFITAYSVVNGKISEHVDVSIPLVHWNNK